MSKLDSTGAFLVENTLQENSLFNGNLLVVGFKLLLDVLMVDGSLSLLVEEIKCFFNSEVQIVGKILAGEFSH